MHKIGVHELFFDYINVSFYGCCEKQGMVYEKKDTDGSEKVYVRPDPALY